MEIKLNILQPEITKKNQKTVSLEQYEALEEKNFKLVNEMKRLIVSL
jgi:hypothetical protein